MAPRAARFARRAGALGVALAALSPLVATASSPAARPSSLVAGAYTAIGDSVMADYAANLAADLPHCSVYAEVGRQWDAGVAFAEQLRARDELATTVIVGLGTNGPVTGRQFDAMLAALKGVRRVVFVTVHVDEPWEAEVNGVLVRGARAQHNVVIAPWGSLAAAHPGWLYPDRTHLPIGGPGARALAHLVASAARPDTATR